MSKKKVSVELNEAELGFIHLLACFQESNLKSVTPADSAHARRIAACLRQCEEIKEKFNEFNKKK